MCNRIRLAGTYDGEHCYVCHNPVEYGVEFENATGRRLALFWDDERLTQKLGGVSGTQLLARFASLNIIFRGADGRRGAAILE